MTRHRRKDIRLWLGKKYLESARLLPQFGGSFIRTLQDITAHHKDLSDDAFKRSRPPKTAQLEFPCFRLIEMFNVEDFDELEDGLFRLFPGLNDEFRFRFSGEAFTKQAESIQGGGWGHLGYILRDKSKSWLGIDGFREIRELPAAVDFIKVEYHKVLPSVFLVTLDVNLTEEATQKLMALQCMRYAPAVRFRNILPWRATKGGWSESGSDSEMRVTILLWLEELRAQVEDCMRPFLTGYFTRHRRNASARLPAVEVYTLKGAPEELSEFSEWSQKERWWLESLGFRFIFDVYSDERSFFAVPEGEASTGRSTYRLLVLWERYRQSVSMAGFGNDERRAINHSTTYALTGFQTIIALHEFLNSISENIAELRRVTFRAMRRRRLLGGYMKQNNTIQRESLLLDRISMEFKQQKFLIKHSARVIGEFREFLPGLIVSGQRNFVTNALSILEKRIKRLKEQTEHIKESSSDFLALQNMRAVYRLQWFVILLTVVSIVASWPNIKEFLKDIFGVQF